MAATSEDTQPSGTTPGGVVEFLLARIAEDEAAAREVIRASEQEGRGWANVMWGYSVNEAHGERWKPRRVLAECEAKRVYFERHERCGDGCGPCDEYGPGRLYQVCDLRFLAAVYADHPDYDESWRP